MTMVPSVPLSAALAMSLLSLPTVVWGRALSPTHVVTALNGQGIFPDSTFTQDRARQPPLVHKGRWKSCAGLSQERECPWERGTAALEGLPEPGLVCLESTARGDGQAAERQGKGGNRNREKGKRKGRREREKGKRKGKRRRERGKGEGKNKRENKMNQIKIKLY